MRGRCRAQQVEHFHTMIETLVTESAIDSIRAISAHPGLIWLRYSRYLSFPSEAVYLRYQQLETHPPARFDPVLLVMTEKVPQYEVEMGLNLELAENYSSYYLETHISVVHYCFRRDAPESTSAISLLYHSAFHNSFINAFPTPRFDKTSDPMKTLILGQSPPHVREVRSLTVVGKMIMY